jgi:hypothetical protein
MRYTRVSSLLAAKLLLGSVAAEAAAGQGSRVHARETSPSTSVYGACQQALKTLGEDIVDLVPLEEDNVEANW